MHTITEFRQTKEMQQKRQEYDRVTDALDKIISQFDELGMDQEAELLELVVRRVTRQYVSEMVNDAIREARAA